MYSGPLDICPWFRGSEMTGSCNQTESCLCLVWQFFKKDDHAMWCLHDISWKRSHCIWVKAWQPSVVGAEFWCSAAHSSPLVAIHQLQNLPCLLPRSGTRGGRHPTVLVLQPAQGPTVATVFCLGLALFCPLHAYLNLDFFFFLFFM